MIFDSAFYLQPFFEYAFWSVMTSVNSKKGTCRSSPNNEIITSSFSRLPACFKKKKKEHKEVRSWIQPLGIVQRYRENNETIKPCEIIFYYLPKAQSNILPLKMTKNLCRLYANMSPCCDNFPQRRNSVL